MDIEESVSDVSDRGSLRWLTFEEFEDDLLQTVSSSNKLRENAEELWRNDVEKFVLMFSNVLDDCYLERISRDFQDHAAGIHASRILHLRLQNRNTNTSDSIIKPRDIKARNRRFQKLQELLTEGIYFKDEEIRRRNPMLYHIYLGKYFGELPPDESLSVSCTVNDCQDRKNSVFLGDILLDANIALKTSTNVKIKNSTNPQESLNNIDRKNNLGGDSIQIRGRSNDRNVDLDKVNELRNDMVKIAIENFLEGSDNEWMNYLECIDNNEKLDNSKELDEAAEDSYFDY
mmetsp:Transcript_47487/g.60978  ORF Transcript_47487/g.60978 Transcript_47487/m.60978 type:complete len:288 (-) Transcript_47487:109-972(-)